MKIAQRTPQNVGARSVQVSLGMTWMSNQIAPSYPCNGSILSYLRNKAGLTQEALARRSGYSRRLISKAEGSGKISSVTIKDLATALSSPGDPVYPEDLIADPRAMSMEFVLGMYRHGRDIVRICRRLFAPNIVYKIAGDPSVLPFAGTHLGPAAVESALTCFFSMFEPPLNHDPTGSYDFVPHGNDVIVWGQTWMHPCGRPLKRPIAISIRLKYERGKIVSCDHRLDTSEVSRVLLEAQQ